MFYFNGRLLEELPFRVALPDGRTRTSLHKLGAEKLASLGIYPADVIKPEISWTQYYGAPVIEVANGRATATYPVLDYSAGEQEGIIEAAREHKRGEIASARYEAETSGVSVGGVTIKTDRESQAMITGAALQALADAEYSCQWKTGQGFIELTAEQIQGVAVAVRMHVQACFDREAELLPLIEAATSQEELDEIVF